MKRLALGLLLTLPAPAFAAGWSTADRSVVAMGTGGTGAARARDPGASSYNPAAGALDVGFAASVGLLLAAPLLSAEAPGLEASTRGGPSTPPHAHLRYSGERFTFGASFGVPFGSQVTWPEDWAGRFELREASVSVLRTSAFAGVRFGDLAFAAGPFVDLGRLGFRRALDFIEAEGQATVDSRATGFGLQAGAFARLSDAIDVGLAYQSRSRLAFAGHIDFDAPPEFRRRTTDQALTARVLLPDRITGGLLWRATPELELAFDVEVLLWSTIDELRLELEGGDALVQPRGWRTTAAPRLGAAWWVLPELELRAGLFLDPSPVPRETVGPAAPDSTRVGLSAGAGFEALEGVRFDVGYQLVTFTGAEATSTGVRYAGTAHLVGASVALRFAAE